jgi:hypothetical protein
MISTAVTYPRQRSRYAVNYHYIPVEFITAFLTCVRNGRRGPIPICGDLGGVQSKVPEIPRRKERSTLVEGATAELGCTVSYALTGCTRTEDNSGLLVQKRGHQLPCYRNGAK